jgi:hypothetical protein
MNKNQAPGSGINIPDPQHWQKPDETCIFSYANKFGELTIVVLQQ